MLAPMVYDAREPKAGGMQTISINQQGFKPTHARGELLSKEGSSNKRAKYIDNGCLDQSGYIGWVRTKDDEALTFNYPDVGVDLLNHRELPTKGNYAIFGSSCVTGDLGRPGQTFTVGGTVNIVNTGNDPISIGDDIWVVCMLPNPNDRHDLSGKLGKSQSDAPMLRRKFLTGFVFRNNPTGKLLVTDDAEHAAYRPIRSEEVYHLGKAMQEGRPGRLVCVKLDRPKASPLWFEPHGNAPAYDVSFIRDPQDYCTS